MGVTHRKLRANAERRETKSHPGSTECGVSFARHNV
jgi:hypothetical protein